jgi:hypothetical protein
MPTAVNNSSRLKEIINSWLIKIMLD